MTLRHALARGGGPTQRGTERNLRLHRRDANGAIQVINNPKLDEPAQARGRAARRRKHLLDEPPTMNLRQYFFMFRVRWRLALGIMLATVAIAVPVILMLPKQYTASTSLGVEIKSPDPITMLLMPTNLASQEEIIRSERVTRKVIETLGLEADPQLRETMAAGSRRPRALRGLAGGGAAAAPDGHPEPARRQHHHHPVPLRLAGGGGGGGKRLRPALRRGGDRDESRARAPVRALFRRAEQEAARRARGRAGAALPVPARQGHRHPRREPQRRDRAPREPRRPAHRGADRGRRREQQAAHRGRRAARGDAEHGDPGPARRHPAPGGEAARRRGELRREPPAIPRDAGRARRAEGAPRGGDAPRGAQRVGDAHALRRQGKGAEERARGAAQEAARDARRARPACGARARRGGGEAVLRSHRAALHADQPREPGDAVECVRDPPGDRAARRPRSRRSSSTSSPRSCSARCSAPPPRTRSRRSTGACAAWKTWSGSRACRCSPWSSARRAAARSRCSGATPRSPFPRRPDRT